MMWFRKKSEEISRSNPGFEEEERRTPKAGVVLLIVMFLVGVYFGWQSLSDIAAVITAPESLSNCSYRFQEADSYSSFNSPVPTVPYDKNYYQGYYGDSVYPAISPTVCKWSKFEQDAGVDKLYADKMAPLEAQYSALSAERSQVSTSLSSIESQLNSAAQEYGVGLQELEAKVGNPIFKVQPYQANIPELLQKRAELESKLASLDSEIADNSSKLKAATEDMKVAYRGVFQAHEKALRWYEFKVFLLQMLFVLPLFFLVFRFYLRLQKKNSPYAIIAVAALAVASLLLLRVVLVWFHGLFLARIIEVLLQWFHKFELVRTVLYYLGMLLSFAIFGGAVFFLQRKVFDPRRVALRRFRSKQCPRCQASLDIAENFCPNCGAHIREACPNCGQPRYVDLPICPACGHKKNDPTPAAPNK